MKNIKYATINKYKNRWYEIRLYKDLEDIVNDNEPDKMLTRNSLHNAQKYCKEIDVEVIMTYL